MKENLEKSSQKSILQDPLEIIKRPVRGSARWASKNKGLVIGGALAYLLLLA